LFESAFSGAQALENEHQTYDAYLAYSAILSDFNGLLVVDAVRRKAAQLKETGAYRNQEKVAQKLHKTEEKPRKKYI